MAGERNGIGRTTSAELHLDLAARMLAEGAVARAFSELVRASRSGPMTVRLAAALVRLSLKAGTEPAAVALLEAAAADPVLPDRIGVRRHLVRLLRKLGEPERAREHLVLLLAERPDDRRARAVLNALLEQEGRWEELDASLEREVKDAVKLGRLERASRSMLKRARLYGERLDDHARAALRYGQAVELAEKAGDRHAVFGLCILWLRSLRQSEAPRRAVDEAARKLLEAGRHVGKEELTGALLRELGLHGHLSPVPKEAARRQTQLNLVAAAEEAEAEGRQSEAAALLSAAVQEGPEDRATARKLEAHYVARRAWRELAQFYRDRAAKLADVGERIDALARLAELLEDELHDLIGAAKAYGEIVALTGDKQALAEQVRLLNAREDVSGVRRALDEAVERAADPASRANALVARAEWHLARKELPAARADFEEALAQSPQNLAAHAGLAEVGALMDDSRPVLAFRDALQDAPKRFPGRGEMFRRLARLADAPLGDAHLAIAAWSEVLAEQPADEEAILRLDALSRAGGQWEQLELALRAQIRREPRGERTRKARLELVELLERRNRRDEALEELHAAVRFEPGHKEAWLELAERLIARGENEDGAWALEQAATAMSDEAERLRTWERLATFTQEVLRDFERAAVYRTRARNLREEIEAAARARMPPESQPGVLTPMGRSNPPEPPRRPNEVAARRFEKAAAPVRESPHLSSPGAFGEAPRVFGGGEWAASPSAVGGAALSPLGELLIPPPPRAVVGASAPPIHPDRHATEEVDLSQATPMTDSVDDDWEGSTVGASYDSGGDVLESTTGEVPVPAEAFAEDASPTTQEIPVALGEAAIPVAPSVLTPAHSARDIRERLFQRVREDPLDADAYRQLADYFDGQIEPERSSLMLEIANALDGDPLAAPRAPRLICSAADRAGLRHPWLRTEAGELFSLTGAALTRLFPAKGRTAGSSEEFRFDSGRGSQAAAEALLAAVRILGLRAPDVYISEEAGPPFALVYAEGPRLLVGRLAVKRPLPDAELRFFAGRALFSQNPDLLVLRTLKREQLQRALAILGTALLEGRPPTPEGRLVRDSLPARSLDRIRELYERHASNLDLRSLADGARHSANRAGLVVCGGVAPALAALRAKRALPAEVIELVRFAASERYLQLRTRNLG